MSSTRNIVNVDNDKTTRLLMNALAIVTAKSTHRPLSLFEAIDKLSHEMVRPPSIATAYLGAFKNLDLELNLLSAIRVNSLSKKTESIVEARAKAFLALLDVKFEESEAFEKISGYTQKRIERIPAEAKMMELVLNHILTLSTDSKHLTYSEALEMIMHEPEFYGINKTFTRDKYDDLLSVKAFYDYAKSQALAMKVHDLEDETGSEFNLTKLEREVEIQMQQEDSKYKAYVVTQNEKKRNHTLQVQESNLFEEHNAHLSKGVGMMVEPNRELPPPNFSNHALTWVQAIIMAIVITGAGACLAVASRYKGLYGVCGIFKSKPRESTKSAAEETALISLHRLGKSGID